jgi:hypothetical protein
MNSHLDNTGCAERNEWRTARGACLLLWRAASGLVAGWWRSDRIRISPREGELLRLQRGSVVTVNGIVAEVRSRTVVNLRQSSAIHYGCQTEHGPARLEVRWDEGAERCEIIWTTPGENEALLEHQVEVFR